MPNSRLAHSSQSENATIAASGLSSAIDISTARRETKKTKDKVVPGAKFDVIARETTGSDMTHPSLLNPFHARQELAQKANQRWIGSTRSTPICSSCRSDDIISHATAQWSNEKQEWELANTFAQPAHCNSCNGPCEIVWLPLN